jgi:hypothetical protein
MKRLLGQQLSKINVIALDEQIIEAVQQYSEFFNVRKMNVGND